MREGKRLARDGRRWQLPSNGYGVCDMVLVSPTVYLDGVVMCENNKLNPDLGLGGP